MSTRQQELMSVLERLAANLSSDISGTVAVSNDGIILASRMSSDVNADRVGAVAATMIGVTKRVAGELRIGVTEEAIIKANNGYFLVMPAGEQALLAISLRQGANLGMVRIEARDAASAISRVL
jgi:uncharacterized protein